MLIIIDIFYHYFNGPHKHIMSESLTINMKHNLEKIFNKGKNAIFVVNGKVVARLSRSQCGNVGHHCDWPNEVVEMTVPEDSHEWYNLILTFESDVARTSKARLSLCRYYNLEGDTLNKLLSKFVDSGAKLSSENPRTSGLSNLADLIGIILATWITLIVLMLITHIF